MGSLTRKGARRFAVALAAESCMSTFDVLMSGCPLTCVMCSFLSVGETAGPLTRFDHHASKSWTASQAHSRTRCLCRGETILSFFPTIAYSSSAPYYGLWAKGAAPACLNVPSPTGTSWTAGRPRSLAESQTDSPVPAFGATIVLGKTSLVSTSIIILSSGRAADCAS